jgi:hypothetical protein
LVRKWILSVYGASNMLCVGGVLCTFGALVNLWRFEDLEDCKFTSAHFDVSNFAINVYNY